MKKLVFSGIQPTGTFTLGNYLGAIKNWATMQNEYDCVYCVVDMHAITVRQNPAELRKNTLDALAMLIACGIDPEKSVLFIQSHNRNHAELAWVLSCNTQFGELSRMTQFKDKSQKHADDVNAGLFTYPVLMAADILVYNADLVPVGVDQRQHLELTRDVAQRFNNHYGEFFKLPEAYLGSGAKVMSLGEPTKKMSKSDENSNAYILLTDEPKVIVNKFKKAVTDSETEIVYKEGKDGINNLITIYSAITNKDVKTIENEFAGKGYGDFKIAVGEAVATELQPIREKFDEIRKDKTYLENVYKQGAEKSYALTRKLMSKLYHKVGFIN
ncbi:MAG: tryptophan--tRNA ligase [Ruminococcus sp.]|jgi:tryptophanyl-tRNA synthetase|nr:tryptophan--tRNA ligase [Ruminococcus sp.]